MANGNNTNSVARALGGGALAAFASPKWDLIGPTVDDDIRRAVARYGAEAVKNAVKEATKAKRGRKREPDWPELREVFESDARIWLAGGDPFAARSNYAIAKEFAERSPGHSVISTHKRIERKLSKGPYDRRWWTFVTAENFSRDGYPYTAHLRALAALAELPSWTMSDVWQRTLERARATVADYEAREGEPPSSEMTFQEIEDAVAKGGLNALLAPPRRGGLFGLASSSQSGLGSILSNALKPAED
jgi:hypothetical protein